jgi:hypothetical protein
MKKLLLICLLAINFIAPTTALAQEPPQRFTRTILPEVNKDIASSNAGCRLLMTRFEDIYFYGSTSNSGTTTDTEPSTEDGEATESVNADLGSIRRFDEAVKAIRTVQDDFIKINFSEATRNDVLGCAIVTGRIRMMYLSIFISYALNMLTIVSGSISMLFIIFGGYQYVIGALTQSTDAAKKTIINAILGLLVSTGSWIIINIVLAVITS